MNFFHKRFDASTNQCFKCTYEIPTQHWGNPDLFLCWSARLLVVLQQSFGTFQKNSCFLLFSSLLVCVFSNLVHYDPKVVQSLRMLVDMKLFSRNFFTSHFESQGHCKVTNSLSLSHLTIFSFRNLSFSLGIVSPLGSTFFLSASPSFQA